MNIKKWDQQKTSGHSNTNRHWNACNDDEHVESKNVSENWKHALKLWTEPKNTLLQPYSDHLYMWLFKVQQQPQSS